jgi:hypothetical protein
MPGKRWKDGAEGWERDMAMSVGRLRESLTTTKPPSPTDKEVNLISRDIGFAETRYHLGLFEWWAGQEAMARELLAVAATTIEALLERWLPTRPLDHYTSYALEAHMGAMAASIVGLQPLARKLFAQAELLATGLLTEDTTPPLSYLDALDHASVIRPYTRLYSLIRLGRLSGFHAFIYTVPLEQARKATPVWKRTTVLEALDTADLCHELWRRERRMDYTKQKKLSALLRALVACLSPGAGEPERLAARKALQAYQDSIHDLFHFQEIYPRVLDLRAAWPHLFG